MKYFPEFPDTTTCPICGTSDKGECFLMPVMGTSDGRICETQPTHRECVSDAMVDGMQLNREIGIVFMQY